MADLMDSVQDTVMKETTSLMQASKSLVAKLIVSLKGVVVYLFFIIYLFFYL